MSLDLLVLNSGEWLLSAELAAEPWYILVYRQRGQPLNEIQLWLPRQDAPRSEKYAAKRYWLQDQVRWCIEIPSQGRLRFTAPDGRVLWTRPGDGRGLADLTNPDLDRLLGRAIPGSFSGV